MSNHAMLSHGQLAGILTVVVLAETVLSGQQTETFRARLTPVPVNPDTAETTLGFGSVTATLDGNRLTIGGNFEQMNSPARESHVHRAFKGLRGPSLFTLTTSKAPQGEITGVVSLTASQIADLKNGRLYIQIHTEQNPDGHLRGWLLPTPPKS
jgi:hypothetical protein